MKGLPLKLNKWHERVRVLDTSGKAHYINESAAWETEDDHYRFQKRKGRWVVDDLHTGVRVGSYRTLTTAVWALYEAEYEKADQKEDSALKSVFAPAD